MTSACAKPAEGPAITTVDSSRSASGTVGKRDLRRVVRDPRIEEMAEVLLRWKTGENEYRVIFADLHAETITADALARLEAALPK